MIERKFVNDQIKSLAIEEYLSKTLSKADYSHTDIQITPLSTRLVIYVGRPGIAIGRAGKNIEMVTNVLSDKFDVKNPQLDIQTIVNPDLDATYVAHQISSAIERYVKPGRMVNIYLRNIMKAGAYGAEIRVSGKISGGRGRTDKTQIGYIKKSGDFAVDNVDIGFAQAKLKQGVLGIKVMIMKALPESMCIEDKIKAVEAKAKEDKKKAKADKLEDKKKEEISDDKKAEKKEGKKPEEKKAVKKEDKKPAEKKDDKKPEEKKAVKKEDKKAEKKDDKKPEEKKAVKKEEKKAAAKKK